MSDAYVAMQGIVDRLRELGQSTETIAADIAPELRAELERSIAAGQEPDGTPWKLTLKGKKPLQNAAAALVVDVVGTRVIAALHGIEARHHYGAVRGKIRRRILPSSKLPAQYAELVTRVAQKRFRTITGGR